MFEREHHKVDYDKKTDSGLPLTNNDKKIAVHSDKDCFAMQEPLRGSYCMVDSRPCRARRAEIQVPKVGDFRGETIEFGKDMGSYNFV